MNLPSASDQADANALMVNLHSIVQRLDLARLFPKAQPLEVELGSGDGSFLLQYASLHPERNFLAVERLLGRLRKLDRKGRRGGLANLRAVRIEASYFLEYLLPKSAAAAIHIYFPDPWPKRRHHKNRLINDSFARSAASALAPAGMLYLRTDDAGYFAQMQAVFAANTAFAQRPFPDALSRILTDFERDFRSRGVQILRAAYEKI